MTNALAFFPARGQVNHALLSFWPDKVEATGTDTYTLGRDQCQAEDFQTADKAAFPVRVELDRDGWKEIEPQARKDKGYTGYLEYRPGDSLTFRPGGEKAEVATARDFSDEPWGYRINGAQKDAFWDMCDELLTRYGRESGEAPSAMAFDPALFGRFSKVKLSKATDHEKILDFWYQGQGAPMLAKVGATFHGLIMPIDREGYVEGQGDGSQDNLWPLACRSCGTLVS